MIGIYKITNLMNGKSYIGQSMHIEARWKEHKRNAFKENKSSYNYPLYRAIRKYGVENFSFEVIEECSQDELDEKEIYWIEKYDTFKNGYNATLGGYGKRYLNYDLIISTYKKIQNIKEVSKLLNYDEGTISQVLVSNNICIKSQQEINLEKYGKEIGQFSLNGELLNIFPSVKEAAKNIGKPHCHISQCANEKRKTAYGYVWKYL